jgi:hypothetical protein
MPRLQLRSRPLLGHIDYAGLPQGGIFEIGTRERPKYLAVFTDPTGAVPRDTFMQLQPLFPKGTLLLVLPEDMGFELYEVEEPSSSSDR